jgi:hypothetical protein
MQKKAKDRKLNGTNTNGLMDQIMDKEKITKESFMANMVKAFAPETKERDSSKNMSFLTLISAGFGKRGRKKHHIMTISDLVEEHNGCVSRAT